MTPAPIHHLSEVVGFLGRSIHFSAADDELIRSHHATEQPMDRASSSDTADHADIRPIDLGNDLADQVFWQPESVWNSGCRLLQGAHYFCLPDALVAAGNIGTRLTAMASELLSYPFYYEGLPVEVDSICDVPTKELQS